MHPQCQQLKTQCSQHQTEAAKQNRMVIPLQMRRMGSSQTLLATPQLVPLQPPIHMPSKTEFLLTLLPHHLILTVAMTMTNLAQKQLLNKLQQQQCQQPRLTAAISQQPMALRRGVLVRMCMTTQSWTQPSLEQLKALSGRLTASDSTTTTRYVPQGCMVLGFWGSGFVHAHSKCTQNVHTVRAHSTCTPRTACSAD